MPSKGRRCLGILRGAKCKRARGGTGEAVTLNKACSRCREWRCREHCRCGRQGTATGRAAARCACQPQAKAAAKAQASPAQPEEVVVPKPLGRPAAQDTQVFSDNAWRAQVLEEIASASSVVVASFTFDDPALTEALLKRLRGRAAFSLDVLVDSQTFEALTCRHQRPRLVELQRPLRWCLWCFFETIGSRLRASLL